MQFSCIFFVITVNQGDSFIPNKFGIGFLMVSEWCFQTALIVSLKHAVKN